MRSIAKKLVALACAGGLTLGMTACTGGSGTSNEGGGEKNAAAGEVEGDITLQTWSLKNDKFTPYFEKLVKDFEKENPKVKVKWMDQPGDGYEDKLLQQANADELPDVVNIPPEFGLPLAKAGKLMDLKGAENNDLDKYVKGGVEAYQYPGVEGSYGYPWYLGVSFNYWNKDLLKKAGIDKAPANEEEFLADAQKAAEKGVAMVSQAPSIGTLSARGVKVWDPDARKFTFNSEDGVKIVEEYAKLYQAGAIPAELITAVDKGNIGNEAFYKETLAGIQSTPSFADDVVTNAPSLEGKVEVTDPWETPQLLVQGVAVAKNSKHPAAALALAKYLTNNENQVAFVKIAKGFMPGTQEGNKDAASLRDGSETDLMKQALDVSGKTVQRAELLTPVEMSDEMKTAVLQEIALALQGNKTPKEALDSAVQKCNAMIEQ